MPAVSKSQYRYIQLLRRRYGSKAEAPDDHKWAFENDWTHDVDFDALPMATEKNASDESATWGAAAGSIIPGVAGSWLGRMVPASGQAMARTQREELGSYQALSRLMDVARKSHIPVYGVGDDPRFPTRPTQSVPEASSALDRVKDWIQSKTTSPLLYGADAKTLSAGPAHYAPADSGERMATAVRDMFPTTDKLKGAINMGSMKGPNPHVLAHELGHSMQPPASMAPAWRHLGRLGPLAGTLGVTTADNDQQAAVAAGLGTASALPVLGAELDASMKGRKLLQEAMDPKVWEGLGKLRRLSPFVGVPTYLAAAAIPGAAYLGRRLAE